MLRVFLQYGGIRYYGVVTPAQARTFSKYRPNGLLITSIINETDAISVSISFISAPANTSVIAQIGSWNIINARLSMIVLLQTVCGLLTLKTQSRHIPYGRPVRIIIGIMIKRVVSISLNSMPAIKISVAAASTVKKTTVAMVSMMKLRMRMSVLYRWGGAGRSYANGITPNKVVLLSICTT